MTKTEVSAPQEAWGELGPAMRELSEIQRRFVRYYLIERATKKSAHGAQTRAARRAGYNMKGPTLGKHAHDLLHDPTRNEKIIAALAEEAKKITRGVGYAEAVIAAWNGVRDPLSRDHARFVDMFMSRGDPVISKHSLDVTHRTIDPDREALEELRALRKLGTSRDKLPELYGPNGLDRLEALEAVENAQRAAAAKVVDGKVITHEASNG